MKLTGNTILVTGGGSGIGRGLAEAFHKLGNKLSSRDAARPTWPMSCRQTQAWIPWSSMSRIRTISHSVSKELITKYPKLNVLLNNAGIMMADDVSKPIDDTTLDIGIRNKLLWHGADDERADRAPQATGIGNGLECLVCAWLCAAGICGSLQRYEGRPSCVLDGPPLSAQRNIGTGSGNRSALGPDGPAEQQ